MSISRNFTLPTASAGIRGFPERVKICQREVNGSACGVEFRTTGNHTHCPGCRAAIQSSRTCRICGGKVFVKGLCSKHYREQRRKRLGNN